VVLLQEKSLFTINNINILIDMLELTFISVQTS